jgi:hypothetical protein
MVATPPAPCVITFELMIKITYLSGPVELPFIAARDRFQPWPVLFAQSASWKFCVATCGFLRFPLEEIDRKLVFGSSLFVSGYA